MFWYVVDRKIHKDDNLVTFLNKQEGIRAFVPKIEKWYSVRGVKDYIVKDLYPDHSYEIWRNVLLPVPLGTGGSFLYGAPSGARF